MSDIETIDAETALKWRLILGKHSEKNLKTEDAIKSLKNEKMGKETPTKAHAKQQVAKQKKGGKAMKKEGKKAKVGGKLTPQRDTTPSIPSEDLNQEIMNSMDQSLSFLYDRPDDEEKQEGGRYSAGLSVPAWINKVKTLFPKEAVEVIQKDAVEKYKITALVTDPEVLKNVEKNMDLLRAILRYKDLMSPQVRIIAKQIVRDIVEQIKKKIMWDVYRTMVGELNRQKHSPIKNYKNVDWKRTLFKNIKNYDPETENITLEKIFFWARERKRSDWRIIVDVDQSGSMLDSTIYSAILASIFASLPSLKTNLILFDTRFVDMTEYLNDVVEALMAVKLGGGTNIAGSLDYCQQFITNPKKTILVLISDFYEGGGYNKFYNKIKELKEAQVKVIGICALGYGGQPAYDRNCATKLATMGVPVGAYTPKKLAEHIVDLIKGDTTT